MKTKMTRRTAIQRGLAGGAAIAGAALRMPWPGGRAAGDGDSTADPPDKRPPITRQVAEFGVNARFADLPADVLALGKKSILDGLGLALAGSVAETGHLCREDLKSVGFASGSATVIGAGQKVPPRFAAFANGVGIHADDYDDTQLAV